MLRCPKCMGSDISLIGDSHYVCNDPKCTNEGHRTQFHIIEDEKVQFPYNQIFVGRPKHQFVRKPYLKLEDVGIKETTR